MANAKKNISTQPPKKKSTIFNKRRWEIGLLIGGIAGQQVLAHYEQSTAGLIVGIVLCVIAIIIVIDFRNLSLNKPKFWNRANLTLLLVAVFEIILIIFTFVYINNEREKHHPDLAVTQTMIGRIFNEETKKVDVNVEITFKNNGDRSAYKLKFTRVIAALENLQGVRLLPNEETGGTIGAGEQIIIPTTFSVNSADGISANSATEGIAFYWNLEYTDSLGTKARVFSSEQWAVVYLNIPDTRVAYMPEDVKYAFEVFVNRLLKSGGKQ